MLNYDLPSELFSLEDAPQIEKLTNPEGLVSQAAIDIQFSVFVEIIFSGCNIR